MLRPFQFLCLLCMLFSAIASAQPSRSQASRKPETLRQLRLNAPQLVWQASMAGRETVRLAGVGAGRIAVLAEPGPRMENGVYLPHSIQLTAFDVKSGTVAWRKEILGGDISTAADNSRLYLRLQLPLVSYDPFDYKPADLRYEILTFRWSDGRTGWRVSCSGRGSLLAWDGHVFYDGREGSATDTTLVAVDAEMGNEQWKKRRSDINGLFPARGVLYAYDDARNSEGGIPDCHRSRNGRQSAENAPVSAIPTDHPPERSGMAAAGASPGWGGRAKYHAWHQRLPDQSAGCRWETCMGTV